MKMENIKIQIQTSMFKKKTIKIAKISRIKTTLKRKKKKNVMNK